jgi:hypothetical protein
MMEYEEKMNKIEKIAFDQIKKLGEADEKHEYDLIRVLKMMNNKGG